MSTVIALGVGVLALGGFIVWAVISAPTEEQLHDLAIRRANGER
jgi:hypothetical protein